MNRYLRPDRDYLHLGYYFPAIVKQFTALALFLLVPFVVHAQHACSGIFQPSAFVSERDMDRNIRGYYAYIHKYGKKSPSKVTVTLADGTKERINTPENFQHLVNPSKNLDIGVMGFLGKVFDLKYDRQASKVFAESNEYYRQTEMTKAKDWLNKAKGYSSKEFVREIQNIFDISELPGGFINLRTDTGRKVLQEQDPLQRALKNRFMVMYLHLVNWSYRISGLEKNKSLSNFTMMDEVIVLAKELKALQLNMVFDPVVWEAHLRVLETKVGAYKSEMDPKRASALLEEISQPNDPFLPMAGVAVSYSILNPRLPVEIKRYFKNDFEDALNLLSVSQKNEYLVRHQMIYKMISDLPQNQGIEIHAHSLVHARAYLKLGFRKSGTIENPQYPGVVIHLLKGQREEVLSKIESILDEH